MRATNLLANQTRAECRPNTIKGMNYRGREKRRVAQPRRNLKLRYRTHNLGSGFAVGDWYIFNLEIQSSNMRIT
jgi:hypothetical protein